LPVKYSDPWHMVVCPLALTEPKLSLTKRLNTIAAPVFQPPPHEGKLVVLRAQVGVVGVDQGVQVVCVGGLELLHQCLLGAGVLLIQDLV
jgi:hypothetical protein